MKTKYIVMLATGKLILGLGLGIIIASHFWHTQPYWLALILIGALITVVAMYKLRKLEKKALK